MMKLRNFSKSFGTEDIFRELTLDVQRGETLAILGKSGCGKSTLLKCMAGLENPDEGTLSVDGTEMLKLKPQQRQIVYLSQEPLLFPHLTVEENLAFGLRVRRHPADAVRKATAEMAERLGLDEHLHKKPEQLSGGQRQRVNFGRALIIDPKILLLDEPFGSLDAQTRREMQDLFSRIQRKLQITSLFVTHDLKEALLMGQRSALMKGGKLKVYNSREEFMNCPDSGVKDELDFWQSLNNRT